MKRSPALAALSRDHQHALDAALRLRRADAGTVAAAAAHFTAFFETEGRRHFEIEEELLLTALPGDPEWTEQATRVADDHAAIRAAAAVLADPGAQDDPVAVAHALGDRLHDHVRFEERTLFATLERRLDPPRLEALGRAIDAAERG